MGWVSSICVVLQASQQSAVVLSGSHASTARSSTRSSEGGGRGAKYLSLSQPAARDHRVQGGTLSLKRKYGCMAACRLHIVCRQASWVGRGGVFTTRQPRVAG
jgi:hypothetical protein